MAQHEIPHGVLNDDQIKDAVREVMRVCDREMERYTMLSTRGVLYELGYQKKQVDQIITWLFEHGFNYCIDPMFPVTNHDTGVEEPTPAFACSWGPDQLKSRLHWCV